MDESEASAGSVDLPVTGAGMAKGAPPEVWSSCVSAIARGDESALAELYDGTSSLVFSLALRVVGNTEDAEEIAADVYSQVWKTAPSYDRSRSSVLGWLVMLTRSRSIDRLRSRAERTRREAVGELPTQIRDPRPVPEEACSFGQRGLLVRRALLTLPGEQRELIELSFFHGLTHSEVAKRKALPLGTVKTRIRLGMLKLRDLLEGIEEAGHES